MPTAIGTPERTRADEAWAMVEQAKHIDDPEVRRAMLRIAVECEMLARQAEARDAKRTKTDRLRSKGLWARRVLARWVGQIPKGQR